ncbi:MAG: hypothetical protein P4M14_10145 [Gammaproteobacteria bacterium]|nr:hypothetical protein [Gammaproteobacteria bacterium]
MLNKITQFSLAMILGVMVADVAHAVQCPKVASSQSMTFLHQVVSAAEPQPWQMDITYLSQGWSVVSNPLTENSQLSTVLPSTPLSIVFTKTNLTSTAFLVVCQYQIESGSNPISLTVTNSQVFAKPINPNFKKISDTSYVCRTDAAHPENCNDADIHPVVCGLGQSC